MQGFRGSWIRGVLVLGLLGTFGAGMVVSSAGAVVERREASKKFVNKRIDWLRDELTKKFAQAGTSTSGEGQGGTPVEAGDLIRFGPVQMNKGAAPQTVATVGPFSITARCDDLGEGYFRVVLEIRTSEGDSSLRGPVASDGDFDPDDGPHPWVVFDAPDDGDAEVSQGQSELRAQSPSGTWILGFASVVVNWDGFDCNFAGEISTLGSS